MRLIKRAAVVIAVSISAVVVPATSAHALEFPLPDQFLGTFPALPFIASVSVQNTVGFTVGLDSLTITPTDPSDVFIVDASDCLGRPIPHGSSCMVSATVIPSSTGTHTAHVVASGASIEGFPVPVDFTMNVSVELVEPDVDLGQFDLGDLQIGVPTSGNLTFPAFPGDITILNASVVAGGPNASDITAFDISDCVGTIEANKDCTIKATATVGAEGPRTATFVITADINGIASTFRGTVIAN